MHRILLDTVVGSLRLIGNMELSLIRTQDLFDRVAASMGVGPDVLISRLWEEKSPSKPLEELRVKFAEIRQELPGLIEEVKGNCEKIHLHVSKCTADRINDEIGEVPRFGELASWFKRLRETIEDELKQHVFMFLPPDMAKYFSDEKPFGEKVWSKFSQVNSDVEDASRCLGAGLPTGAVFYLMRVLEFGIRRLARRLNVKARKVRRKTWDTVLKEITGAISALSALPNLSAKKRVTRDRCAKAAAHLDCVRIAWRNPVMHAEGTYSLEEAAKVFEHVKTFMNHLATEVL